MERELAGHEARDLQPPSPSKYSAGVRVAPVNGGISWMEELNFAGLAYGMLIGLAIGSLLGAVIGRGVIDDTAIGLGFGAVVGAGAGALASLFTSS
jgi:hypothetical protein